MKDVLHVAAGGGGCLARAAAVLTGAQIGGVPIPPVMLAVRLLVRTVVLGGFAEELRQCGDVHGPCAVTSIRDRGAAL